MDRDNVVTQTIDGMDACRECGRLVDVSAERCKGCGALHPSDHGGATLGDVIRRVTVTLKTATKQVDAWNTINPIGTPVDVRLDDGTIFKTKTRSKAWVVGGPTAVVLVKGIRGGYLLDRVTPSEGRER